MSSSNVRSNCLGAYRNLTIADVAAEKARALPNEVACYFDQDQPVTFSDIYQEAQALAGALQAEGCQPGDVISFQLPNWREAIALDIAAAMLGLVVNPIIPIYRDKEVSYILQDTQAQILLIPELFRGFDFVEMVRRLQPNLPNLKRVLVVGGVSKSADDVFIGYQHFLAGAGGHQLKVQKVDPDSVKIVMYTSGTTGNPKAVQHSHNSLTQAFDNGCAAWSFTEDDVMLMPSPVTHITGFVNGIELPFLSKAKTAFMEQWQVDKAVEYIKQVKATMCISATPFLQELVQTCKESGERLETLRLFACGGASVPPGLIYDTHQVLARCRAFRVYGSTESPLVTVGFIDSDKEQFAAETDGCIFNWQVRVVDPNGRELPQGEDGEILVRGPAMMMGYRDQNQTTEALTEDGFFCTGDIGHITLEGAIVITDRKKDIIIRGGENLSAREIEDVLHEHPLIDQVAVVSMPHPRLGEGVCAYAVLSKAGKSRGEGLELAGLKTYLQATGLAKQKWPERIIVQDSLPMTASGKVRKDVLRNALKAEVAAG